MRRTTGGMEGVKPEVGSHEEADRYSWEQNLVGPESSRGRNINAFLQCKGFISSTSFTACPSMSRELYLESFV